MTLTPTPVSTDPSSLPPDVAVVVRAGGQRSAVVGRVLRNRLAVVGLMLLSVLAAILVVGPLLWRVDPLARDLANSVAGPSRAHPLGTDTLGRDVLSRLLHGARTSLLISLAAVAVSVVVGGCIGLVAGYTRGPADGVLMRLMDVILCFPALLLAIGIAATSGSGVVKTIVAVAVPGIPVSARVLRSSVISVRESDYVTAAVASGVRRRKILVRHVLRNSVTPLVVQSSIGVGLTVLTVAALGYLGLGVVPPDPELGAILSDALTYLVQRPFLLVAPGLTIALIVIAFSLVGDALRDAVDVS